MEKHASSSQINLAPAALRLLRAMCIPTSLGGARRTLPIAQECLAQAQKKWPNAPFAAWKETMTQVKVELDNAVQKGNADPVSLISTADTSNGVLYEIQRWSMSAVTSHEATLLALMGRAFVVYQQANETVQIDFLKGLHTLRLAFMKKGRRSVAWDELVAADLTCEAQVQRILESTPTLSPTHSFLATLSFVLSNSVPPPQTNETFGANNRTNECVDLPQNPLLLENAENRAHPLLVQNEGFVTAIDKDSQESDSGHHTSPRISARLSAADYASVAEKLGLHDRDRLFLDDLISITKQLVPIIQSDDLVRCGFAVLAILSLISCSSDHSTLKMGFEPKSDGLWLDLESGSWAWDFASYQRSGATQDTAHDITPVRVPMPSVLYRELSNARKSLPTSRSVSELICLIQKVDDFDLKGYREFLRALGDRAHPAYQARFARSYQSCLLSISGSDMLTALLSASFSMTAPAALFYFGPTYKTIHSNIDRVFQKLGLGSAVKMLSEDDRAGCEIIPSETACKTSWESLVHATNHRRQQCMDADDGEERVRLATQWMEHLCAAFVLQVAHRGTRLELLTAQALLTDSELICIHDKDNTTKRERQHARLLPVTRAVKCILSSVIECHAVMHDVSTDHVVVFAPDVPLFRKFKFDIDAAVETVTSQSVAQIIAHHFRSSPINIGRAIWVTGLDQASCERWLIRGLTGHTRDITRVGDAMFDVSPVSTARKLLPPMNEVSATWFGNAELQTNLRNFELSPSTELLLIDEPPPKQPGVPDPRILLQPVNSKLLASWKLATQIRSSLIRGELSGSAGALALLHLTFFDLLPTPEVGIRAIDQDDSTSWYSSEPFPGIYWFRPHFKHPVWLPIMPTTWMMLNQTTPTVRSTLLKQVEGCIRASRHSSAFAPGCDVWAELCSSAKAFRRLEMMPTMQAVSHPFVPAPCLNPQSIFRLLNPDTISHSAPKPLIKSGGSRNMKARASDLVGMSKILQHVSNHDVRLGERRQRVMLAIESIEKLQVEWSPAGTWVREWILEDLVRSLDNIHGCYQVSSLATYLSTLIVDTKWACGEDPYDWDEAEWTGFIELINLSCCTPEDKKSDEIVPRAKYALSALIRSLMRRAQHVPHSILRRLAEPTESVTAWDSASAVLILHEDFARAIELIEHWLSEDPATLRLASTRAAICAAVPIRAGEVSSLPWDCLTRHNMLVIRRTGFNNFKTETSIRTVLLDESLVNTIQASKINARILQPGCDLLMRGVGEALDVELDNRALDYWKAALKAATADPKARPHSQRSATLQELAWPSWQGFARELTSCTMTRAAAAAWLEFLQSKWHRLAQATASAGQSGIQSAIGHYLSGWPIVHAIHALALLGEEPLRPALLRQLGIPPDRYRQAKSRSARSNGATEISGKFCNIQWLWKQIREASTTQTSAAKISSAIVHTLPVTELAEISDLAKLRFMCAIALGVPALRAQKELNIPWSIAVRLEQLSASQEDRIACQKRARSSPSNESRSHQADRELFQSETGEQILTWLLGLRNELLDFLMLALFRDKPAEDHIFDDQERWQDTMEYMPKEFCIVVRRGQAYVTSEHFARALRDRPRFQLIPDPKLGRRPLIRLTLAEKDNKVISSRLTSVTRIAVLSLQLLRNIKHGTS